MIVHVSSFMFWSQDEFKAFLKAAGCKLAVVEFSAKWCGPCKKICPLVQVSIISISFSFRRNLKSPNHVSSEPQKSGT